MFQGVPQSGRKVEIDLHTKGLNQTILDSALATGMPIKLSPKYWAEHMGLPYHQAAIRDLEMPRPAANNQGFFSLSTGERIFTRYGYADFLKEDRPYTVMTRIWPGTHRFLLWGDPGLDRRALARLRFLRQQRRRAVRAAILQRPPWIGPSRRPLCLRRHFPDPALGLGKISLHLSPLGTPPL